MNKKVLYRYITILNTILFIIMGIFMLRLNETETFAVSTVKWSVKMEGNDTVLYITGTGPVENYKISGYDSTAPWGRYKNTVSKIVIGQGITEIGDFSFYNFTKVKNVSFPKSITRIGKYSFYYNTGLTKLTLPDNLKIIDKCGFAECLNLTDVSLNKNLKTLNDSVFLGCRNLNYINIPNGLIYLGAYCFENCEKLTSVKLPEEITVLRQRTFYNCKSLSSISLPQKLTTMEEYAFGECVSIKTLNLCASLKNINYSAFSGCKNINLGFPVKNTLETPDVSQIKNTEGGINIKWTKVSGAKNYLVYRKTQGSAWSIINTTDSNEYTDYSVKNNVIYYYRVRPVNGIATGEYSAEIKYKYITAAGVNASLKNGKKLEITWTEIIGADKYIIYRKKMGSTWETGWVQLCSTSSVKYTDNDIIDGFSYAYKIFVCSGNYICSPSYEYRYSTKDRNYITTENELYDAVNKGGVITLGSDIILTKPLNINKSITIQGNGYAIKGNDVYNLIMFEKASGSILRINNCKLYCAKSTVIYLKTGKTYLTGCDVGFSSENDGIGIGESANVYIDRCVVHDNYDEGISSHNKSYTEVTNTKAYNNGYIIGTKNKGAKSSFGGIHIGGSRMGVIKNCESCNNCTYGISFINFQEYITPDTEICYSNKIKENGMGGIFCMASKQMDIHDNVISANKGDAIHIGLEHTFTPAKADWISSGRIYKNNINGNRSNLVIAENDSIGIL